MASRLLKMFSVMRKAPELITPASSTPRVILKLSDIDDQEGLRHHVPFLFFYKNNPSPAMKGKDPVKVIKKALSRALVFYYPLAGRLKEEPNRKLVVDCTSEGVLFIEADANVKLEHFGDEIQVPCPYLDQLLYKVPGSEGIVGCPLLLIQVTRLVCRGFVLALRFNHTICDGFGLKQFLKAVEDMTRGAKAPSVLPVWQRELLNARDPPCITCMHHEYEPLSNAKDIFLNKKMNEIDHKSFYFGPKEIATLRNQLPAHLRSCSTFELLTACLWKCRTFALEPDHNENVRVSIVATVLGNHYNMLIPAGYYGNTIAVPAVCSKTEDLCKNPLGYAVELVKTAKSKMNEEYIRSAADFMVIKERPKCSAEGNFFISDTIRLGLEEVDLGWEKALYAGPTEAVSFISYYVKYQKRDGENGIMVPICLPLSTMERFQEEIKKMTQEKMYK